MDTHPGSLLTDAVRACGAFQELMAAVERDAGAVALTGAAGSLKSFVIATVQESAGRPLLVICPDTAGADRWKEDLRLIMGASSARLFGAGRPLSHGSEPQRNVDDVETLRALATGDARAVVTHPAGLRVRLPAPGVLARKALVVEEGARLEFRSTLSLLDTFNFERKQFVESPGDYAVRGGIVDVFPFVGENPLRIEFAGDEVESVREFDPLSQRSIKELRIATIVPDLLAVGEGDATATLLDYVSPSTIAVVDEPAMVARAYGELRSGEQDEGSGWEEVGEILGLLARIDIRGLQSAGDATIDFGAVAQPAFNGATRVLQQAVVEFQAGGLHVICAGDSPSEIARLKDLLAVEPADAGARAPDLSRIIFQVPSPTGGFVCSPLGVALLTEHQIFNRVKRRSARRRQRFRGFTERELQQLRRGDYVVHEEYGIGRFDGLRRIRVRDVEQEVLRLVYEGGDTLYVNLNYVTRVQKYSSREGHVPKLTRLGRPDWERLKESARKRIKDIARDLISLYAERKQATGFACGPDAPWQQELEASFMYEDTFDQARTTLEVKQDMEAPSPMDRLVCGDVGFGKTEVAVRAAFKAVLNGKQVAVLVPTTILALQHFNTFTDRMARYSTSIQVLSRFKTKAEQARILDLLSTGTVDIVIGTHRLLSKDVVFKDLGLLIIDEEHRFGVAAKEKLRRLRTNVDTLTLTATPIPRTLHFSLMGARDLSLIATPPRNRLPVITEITTYSDGLVRDAVGRELQRGGQVYIVHDRVHDIELFAARVREVLPGVRVRTAHGQMHAHELEEVMVDFLERRSDVLVCTKIIESGLDIPNVNTIIIHRADRFGMAELYQLRGRVGRSNTQAYAYLLTPPIEALPRTTLQRLQAVEEFTELGSGFHLAMRDLEIRGAGNLLGAEQSGFIESMGFETYTRILEDAVADLKDQEFRHVFTERERARPRRADTAVELSLPALLPPDYVEADTERLDLYRKLYGVASMEQLEELGGEIRDRFGPPPAEAENLLGAVRIRLAAAKTGFIKALVGASGAEFDFPPETETSFYESERFQKLMALLGSMKNAGVSLKPAGKVLKLVVNFPAKSPKPVQECLNFLARLNAA